jgi:CRP-like cAMP-binding protein
LVNIVNYQLLRGIGLSDQIVLKIVAHTRLRSYLPGDVLYRRGAVAQPWRYVLAGVACLCSPERKSKRDLFGIIGQGLWVGEAPVEDLQTAIMELLCMTEVRVMEVPFEFIRDAFDSEFNFCRYVARVLNDRNLRQSETALIQRVPETVDRVTLCLALMCETFLTYSSARTIHDFKKADVDQAYQSLPFNQTVLASLCDVSRSNLSQTLKQLAHAGLCQVQYSQVTLLRLDAWRHILKIQRNQTDCIGLDAFENLINVSARAQYANVE